MEVTRVDLTEWGDALPSRGFEVFHTPEALSVVDDHTDGELQLYVGYKGQEAIGMLPTVVEERIVGRTVTSPPPAMSIPKLGPLITPTSPKQRKRERVNRRFARAIRDELELDERTTLFRFVCSPEYGDPRPFVWDDDEVGVSFTYQLDLADRTADDVLTAASKSLRRSVKDARELDVSVDVGGVDEARAIYEQTKGRYEEQDRGFTLTWPYVRDLVTELGERARPYVVRSPDGEILSGIIALFSNDEALYWLGGTRGEYDGTSVNSLVHWAIIEDIVAGEPFDSVHAYDLMGADTERLSKYKSKFGADLVPYYVVESGGQPMGIAKQVYQYVAR